MIAIPAGTLLIGSAEFYADEGPVHERYVAAFELDAHPVTNEEFAQFVASTGYVTVAERELDPADFEGADPADLVPGSMVFTPTTGPVDLRDWRQWWRWVPGARWSEPTGPGSSFDDRMRHPVVHVSFEDATSYATWAGKRLPTESEWEWAARGGLVGARFAWGDDERPGGRLMVNRWQGSFPYRNAGADGWAGTSPVGTFAPNGYGLFDMTGNTWEWTTDFYTPRHVVAGVVPAVDAGARTSLLGTTPAGDTRRVLKGGSHLCSPDYCLRYRPAARSPQSEDTAMTHIGFRCAR
ncbi:Formylglycine-generating enzyme, required for sulfatase activity, contains SUMF1/FGE domain [Microbacterium sp. cf046]|uniref:formylglycine-generating enzyme family protein n=1 Tax=Microbacterium sp. cf046 TaxID=1761803 RepID=UPI0008F2AAB7|nr:formylglycine-generating enzyme family protein [Microbacterium sp. cf046]SFS13373.1 Formylglycine-generating enzyme, required for sulfatase activity, contains SUMF1/FGE domain [Microbacterium sp. cf046]